MGRQTFHYYYVLYLILNIYYAAEDQKPDKKNIT
jgi:hypothetical protein